MLHARYGRQAFYPQDTMLEPKGRRYPNGRVPAYLGKEKQKEVNPCWDCQLPRKINYVREDQLYTPPQPLDLVSKRLPRAYPLQVQTGYPGANLRFAIRRTQHAATAIPRQTLSHEMQATITK